MGVTQIKEWFNQLKNGHMSSARGGKQNQDDSVFFDICRTVHPKYAPEGQTMTREYYQQILRRLHDAVWCKRSDFWKAKN